jgi:hypothetical protein
MARRVMVQEIRSGSESWPAVAAARVSWHAHSRAQISWVMPAAAYLAELTSGLAAHIG